MSELIYLLEDEPDIARLFAHALAKQGFETRTFTRISTFCDALAAARPDLCVIDLGLPDGDGAELLEQELAAAETPAIIVSGRGALADKLQSFEAGAEDYLVKPIDPEELAARARVVLRRRLKKTQTAEPEAIAEFDGWRANFSTYTLSAADGGKEALSQAEAVLLRGFLDAPGRVLSRAALLDICGPVTEDSFDRAIDVRVSRLRKKLREDRRNPTIIKTVYGAGYLFAADVTWISR